MRWDDDSDGADGGDDVDDVDDPDDARHDDGDDGDDFPLREGISPAESPRQEGVSSLCHFRREEAAKKLYEVALR